MQELVDMHDAAPEAYPKIKDGICGSRPITMAEV
jgi:hypothetical protein